MTTRGRRTLWMLVCAGMASGATSCAPSEVSEIGAALDVNGGIGGFVLYAERRIRVGEGAVVLGGDVGVARRALVSGGAQVEVEERSFVDQEHNLISPSVKLERSAVVGGVQTDSLANGGAWVRTVAPYPSGAMPALPQAGPVGPLAADVVVKYFEHRALAPGNYGALKDFGTVWLSAGTYSFTSVVLGDRAQVLVSGGLADVRIAGILATGRDARLAPALDWYGELKVGVAGRDSNDAPAAWLGEETVFRGLLAVPHGTLALSRGVRAMGAFAGFDIDVGDRVRIAFQTGFTSSAGTQGIASYVPPPSSLVVGPLAADNQIFLDVGLPLRNLAALQALIDDASDPASPNYGKYLSASDLKATYSPQDPDYAALVAWAQSQGLKVVTYPNNLGVDLVGTAAQIEQAFHANLIVATRADGTEFYELDGAPSIDLLVQVQGVSGLDDYFVPRSVGGGTAPIPGTYQSSDLRSAYLGAPGGACGTLLGSGQKIGLLALNDGFTPADITTYEANTGLSGVPAVSVQVTNDPNGLTPATAPPIQPTGRLGTLEISADIEMAIAMAPGAQAIAFEGRNADSILTVMSNNADVHQFSTSWIFPASGITQAYLTVMAAQGQSFFVGSGDFGAYEPAALLCTAKGPESPPPDIRSLNYVTTVGGTVLQTDATQQYVSETAWSGGGGGILPGVALPAYQAGVNPGNAAVSTTNRNIPDVSIIATQVYVLGTNCSDTTSILGVGKCANNTNPCTLVVAPCAAANLTPGTAINPSGTSLSGPLWAGLTALINEQRSAIAGPLGFANPTLYGIGADPIKYAKSFNDVGAVGASANTNSCGFGYNAVAGYDLTTGLGTPKCELISTINKTGRVFNVVGTLVDLADIDTLGDEHLGPVPISFHLPINPGSPTNSAVFEQCVDDDVKVRLVFSATLKADLQTLTVCVQQGIEEISSPGPSVCDKDVGVSAPLCVDVPPGGSQGFNDGGSLCATDCGSDNHAIWNALLSNGE